MKTETKGIVLFWGWIVFCIAILYYAWLVLSDAHRTLWDILILLTLAASGALSYYNAQKSIKEMIDYESKTKEL
jgi:hypothetical protein